jgi:hypothetical protein
VLAILFGTALQGIVVVDQLTKVWAVAVMQPSASRPARGRSTCWVPLLAI